MRNSCFFFLFNRPFFPRFMILCIQQHEQYFAKIRTDKTAVCNGYDRWNDSMAIWQLVTVAKCYHLTRVVSGFRDFTQCAAVKTQFGWTNDPPQNCPPLEVVIIACHGQEFTMASRPPTIRVRGRLPQVPASKNLKKRKEKKQDISIKVTFLTAWRGRPLSWTNLYLNLYECSPSSSIFDFAFHSLFESFSLS